MEKFKNICQKISRVLEYIIGISLAICLFAGGLGFVGYMVAFCIGGDTADQICTWIYKTYYGTLIRVSTVTTLLTFVLLYFRGDANWKNPFKNWKRKKSEKNA